MELGTCSPTLVTVLQPALGEGPQLHRALHDIAIPTKLWGHHPIGVADRCQDSGDLYSPGDPYITPASTLCPLYMYVGRRHPAKQRSSIPYGNMRKEPTPWVWGSVPISQCFSQQETR